MLAQLAQSLEAHAYSPSTQKVEGIKASSSFLPTESFQGQPELHKHLSKKEKKKKEERKEREREERKKEKKKKERKKLSTVLSVYCVNQKYAWIND